MTREQAGDTSKSHFGVLVYWAAGGGNDLPLFIDPIPGQLLQHVFT
jgi:hypothetical protein